MGEFDCTQEDVLSDVTATEVSIPEIPGVSATRAFLLGEKDSVTKEEAREWIEWAVGRCREKADEIANIAEQSEREFKLLRGAEPDYVFSLSRVVSMYEGEYRRSGVDSVCVLLIEPLEEYALAGLLGIASTSYEERNRVLLGFMALREMFRSDVERIEISRDDDIT